MILMLLVQPVFSFSTIITLNIPIIALIIAFMLQFFIPTQTLWYNHEDLIFGWCQYMNMLEIFDL